MEKLRRSIDQLDSKLLELLNKRASFVKEIGKIKQRENADVEVPQREKEILERLISINQGPLKNEMVKHIFKEIIDTLKILQK